VRDTLYSQSCVFLVKFNAINRRYTRAAHFLPCLSNLTRLRELTFRIYESAPVTSEMCVRAVKRNGTLHSAQFLMDADCGRLDPEPCLRSTKSLLNDTESRLVEAYCQRNKEMKSALRASFPTSNDPAHGEETAMDATQNADMANQPIGPVPELLVAATKSPMMAVTHIVFGLGLGSQTIGQSEADV
jgi:hypothetical protein